MHHCSCMSLSFSLNTMAKFLSHKTAFVHKEKWRTKWKKYNMHFKSSFFYAVGMKDPTT